MKDALEGKKVTGSDMFRPPYGRLTLPQYWAVRKSEHVVFWDVISGDFDTSITPVQVIDNVVSNVRNGSIVVMHDSKKALKNLKGSLDQIIEQLVKRGYIFKTLDTLIEHKNV
jgi:peptidoglycan/xylan/chitin deacetylase (PgdA/CDA1 family)